MKSLFSEQDGNVKNRKAYTMVCTEFLVHFWSGAFFTHPPIHKGIQKCTHIQAQFSAAPLNYFDPMHLFYLPV
jgi:hypothetical protein